MCDQISHALDRAPLHSVGGGLAVFLGQTTAEFSDLEDGEGDRALIVRVAVEDGKGTAIACDGLFYLGAIVADVLDPL